MLARLQFRLAAALLISLAGSAGLAAGTPAAARGTPPDSLAGPPCPSQVLAFDYGWYGGQNTPSPDTWRHWNANGHDAKKIIATGSQYPGGIRRDIAATDYPVLAPYDSQATAVIDQHLLWAQQAGINGLIYSWWGPGTYEDHSLDLLMQEVQRTRSNIKVSVYLETWALFQGGNFSPQFFTTPSNFDPNSRAQIRENAAQWIAYLERKYGSQAAFLRTGKGKARVPVIFIYAAALFAPPEWQAIFARVQQLTGHDAYYHGDIEGADWSQLVGVFDGIHLYTPVPLTVQGDASLPLRIFDSHASAPNTANPYTDPVTVGADYQAWSHEARALGKGWSATVIPGFDDHNVRNPSFVVSRDHGDGRGITGTYDFLRGAALQSRPDWVLITTFNEWHEGSEIEPSVEYGSAFLADTLLWASKHRCRPAHAASPRPPAASGHSAVSTAAAGKGRAAVPVSALAMTPHRLATPALLTTRAAAARSALPLAAFGGAGLALPLLAWVVRATWRRRGAASRSGRAGEEL